MIIQELIDNGTRIRHYSDMALKIKQVETGKIYEDAVDVLPCRYSYAETDEPIEPPDADEAPDQAQE